MKWIARVSVFVVALFLGAFAASFFWTGTWLDVRVIKSSSLTARNLIATWQGNWGHNDGNCTIEIYSVEGNNFYGTLSKEGAVISIEGVFDPKTRRLSFDETEVLRLGNYMTGWSLGQNKGILSQDGRIMVGDGRDDGGQYGWAVSNY